MWILKRMELNGQLMRSLTFTRVKQIQISWLKETYEIGKNMESARSVLETEMRFEKHLSLLRIFPRRNKENKKSNFIRRKRKSKSASGELTENK